MATTDLAGDAANDVSGVATDAVGVAGGQCAKLIDVRHCEANRASDGDTMRRDAWEKCMRGSPCHDVGASLPTTTDSGRNLTSDMPRLFGRPLISERTSRAPAGDL